MYFLARKAYRAYKARQTQSAPTSEPSTTHGLQTDRQPRTSKLAVKPPEEIHQISQNDHPGDISVESRPEVTEEHLLAEQAKKKKEKHDSRVYRWKLIIGLVLPFFLASLDLTVVATALPFIASHFNKFNQLNWIVTAYTLTSSAFIPTFGQLADIFGRHAVLQAAVFLTVVGSTLAAAAQTWGMLLLGRALQGVSAAGLLNVVQICLSDRVSLKDNAKNNTIFSLVSGISYSIGPVVGGYLTNANWRYCFVISIPVAVLAHVIIFVLLRKELVKGTYQVQPRGERSFISAIAGIDYGGTLLFIFGVGLLILATAWGGSTYAWSSGAVLGTLIPGAILFVLFFLYEFLLEPGKPLARAFPRQIAMIPFSLFQKKDTFLLALLQAATGAAMYSVFYFIGIYFTLVEGYESSKAGVQLLYYIPGIGAGAYSAMFLCNIWPSQTFWPLFSGTIIETVGVALITWATRARNSGVVNGMMVVAGAGTGLRFMPGSLHMAGIWPERIAPAMSINRFFLPFGGTIALTIMGSVFNNKMASIFKQAGQTSHGAFNLHNSESLSSIDQLPPALQDEVRDKAKVAVMFAFVSIIPILALGLLGSSLLGNVWIRKSKASDNVEGQDSHEPTLNRSRVIYKSYLWALIRGNVKANQVETQPLSLEDKLKQAREINEARNRNITVPEHVVTTEKHGMAHASTENRSPSPR
ncbi:major facilitator superfamily transporter MFS-1 [Xylona heveae TC161]|uniref:Major facilitator superfamily transporter MFS-1 n=1 Tax=Xylona heveae (strain CBS 132557 / TC161) TaxID=1328760 RepID=A0A165FUU2_XYLHT|nr:major facilitator superfamily transporter MFS-1 [Xylona heveae TC161]KZF21408.1 major facilitator superfamily transporter MFS-1 [Xylona heveae TC161]